MDWKPIETAPKDGTRLLVSDGEEVAIAYFEGCWCENDYDNLWIYPTHWMPLPEPPKI